MQEERQTKRNMEDSGERDEGEQLDMGSPGTTSTQQKPMAHSDRGLMCFGTRRGLSSCSVEVSSLFSMLASFLVRIMINYVGLPSIKLIRKCTCTVVKNRLF